MRNATINGRRRQLLVLFRKAADGADRILGSSQGANQVTSSSWINGRIGEAVTQNDARLRQISRLVDIDGLPRTDAADLEAPAVSFMRRLRSKRRHAREQLNHHPGNERATP